MSADSIRVRWGEHPDLPDDPRGLNGFMTDRCEESAQEAQLLGCSEADIDAAQQPGVRFIDGTSDL